MPDGARGVIAAVVTSYGCSAVSEGGVVAAVGIGVVEAACVRTAGSIAGDGPAAEPAGVGEVKIVAAGGVVPGEGRGAGGGVGVVTEAADGGGVAADAVSVGKVKIVAAAAKGVAPGVGRAAGGGEGVVTESALCGGAGAGPKAIAMSPMPEVAWAPVPKSSSWNPSTEMSRSIGEAVAADSGSIPPR